MGKLLEGVELEQRCKKLGVNTEELRYQTANRVRATDAELQRRVIEAERSLREHKLWIVAVVSAVFSVISAIAAWIAKTL